MKKTLPIKENRIFRTLYRRGASAAGKSMVLYAKKHKEKAVNQLGFTVSVKLGCAAVRNRARRRLKETYRLNETRLKSGYDIVIVARKAACEQPFARLQSEFLSLCQKLNLVEETDG